MADDYLYAFDQALTSPPGSPIPGELLTFSGPPISMSAADTHLYGAVGDAQSSTRCMSSSGLPYDSLDGVVCDLYDLDPYDYPPCTSYGNGQNYFLEDTGAQYDDQARPRTMPDLPSYLPTSESGQVEDTVFQAAQSAAMQLQEERSGKSTMETRLVTLSMIQGNVQQPCSQAVEPAQFRRAARATLSAYLRYLLVCPDWYAPYAQQAMCDVAYHLLSQLGGEGRQYGLGSCARDIGLAMTDLYDGYGSGSGNGNGNNNGNGNGDEDDTGSAGGEKARAEKDAASLPHRPGGRYACCEADCKQKAFGRMADLERHVKSVHKSASSRGGERACDYGRCTRSKQPFTRLDHFRDHLRDYHKEDLPRRHVVPDDEWWRSRARFAMTRGWWRCNACLVARVQIRDHGWTCPSCGKECEPDRRRARETVG